MSDHEGFDGKVDASGSGAEPEVEFAASSQDRLAVAARDGAESRADASVRPVKRSRPKIRLLKYVVLPLFIAAALVTLGAHLGATGPDAWYTNAVTWIAGHL